MVISDFHVGLMKETDGFDKNISDSDFAYTRSQIETVNA
jgi:hypothetical protein